ncbi:hypothetical protein MishRS11D_22790 [Methylomagnum ishizawai]|nr:hypothetical protein MishRS11D_22790 [Methylomagnum ishizawai]
MIEDLKKSKEYVDYNDKIAAVNGKILDDPKHIEQETKSIVDNEMGTVNEAYARLLQEKETKLTQLDKEIGAAEQKRDCEVTDGCAHQKTSPGPIYRSYERVVNAKKAERDKYSAEFDKKIEAKEKEIGLTNTKLEQFKEKKRGEILANQEEQKKKKQSLESEINGYSKQYEQNYPNDFTARLKIFFELRKEDPVLDRMAWSIFILLLFVETLPVLTKMLTGCGEYDILCYEIKQKKHIDAVNGLESYRNSKSHSNQAKQDAINEEVDNTIKKWKDDFSPESYINELNERFKNIWTTKVAGSNDEAPNEISQNNNFYTTSIFKIEVIVPAIMCTATFIIIFYACSQQPWLEDMRKNALQGASSLTVALWILFNHYLTRNDKYMEKIK